MTKKIKLNNKDIAKIATGILYLYIFKEINEMAKTTKKKRIKVIFENRNKKKRRN